MTSPISETKKYKLSELLTEVVTILQTIKAWDKSDTGLLKRLHQEDNLQNLKEVINDNKFIDVTIDYASILAQVRSEQDDPEDYTGDCRIT